MIQSESSATRNVGLLGRAGRRSTDQARRMRGPRRRRPRSASTWPGGPRRIAPRPRDSVARDRRSRRMVDATQRASMPRFAIERDDVERRQRLLSISFGSARAQDEQETPIGRERRGRRDRSRPGSASRRCFPSRIEDLPPAGLQVFLVAGRALEHERTDGRRATDADRPPLELGLRDRPAACWLGIDLVDQQAIISRADAGQSVSVRGEGDAVDPLLSRREPVGFAKGPRPGVRLDRPIRLPDEPGPPTATQIDTRVEAASPGIWPMRPLGLPCRRDWWPFSRRGPRIFTRFSVPAQIRARLER